MSRTLNLLPAALLVAVVPVAAHAAFVLQTPNTPRVITMDTVIDDTAIGGGQVFGYSPSSSVAVLSEGSQPMTANASFRSQSVSFRASGHAPGSLPAGSWTLFGNDANANSTTNENVPLPALFIGRGTGLTGGVTNLAPLGPGNTGLLFGTSSGSAFRETGMTLRVKNGMGVDLIAFDLGFDAWYLDNDGQFANLVVSYSLDNVAYTPIKTLNGLRTIPSGSPDLGNPAHWVSFTLSESIATPTPVPDGSFFYVRLESIRVNLTGSGGNWLVDNISLTPVPIPEPAALSLLAPLGLMLARRR